MFGIGIIFVMLSVVLMLILLSSFILPKLLSVSVVSNQSSFSSQQNHTEQIASGQILVTNVVTDHSIEEAIDVQPTPQIKDEEKKESSSDNSTFISNLNKDKLKAKNLEGGMQNSLEKTEDEKPTNASENKNRSFNFDSMADDLSDIF